MKKIIALLLVLTLSRGFSGTAFAGEVNISTTVPDQVTCGNQVRVERQKVQTWWVLPDKDKVLEHLYYNGVDVTA